MRFTHLLLLAICFITQFGCGGGDSGPPEYPVTGKVTFDGQPIEAGNIMFYPKDETLGPNGGEITNGEFSFDCKAGEMTVKVEATREIPGETVDSGANPGEKEPATEMYIPEKYNDKSELKAEVTSDAAKNTFTFDLKSK